jgi:hypothetical protein
MMNEISEKENTVAMKLLQAYQDNRSLEAKLAALIAAGNEMAKQLRGFEVPECDCNSAQGFHESCCARSIYYAVLAAWEAVTKWT